MENKLATEIFIQCGVSIKKGFVRDVFLETFPDCWDMKTAHDHWTLENYKASADLVSNETFFFCRLQFAEEHLHHKYLVEQFLEN